MPPLPSDDGPTVVHSDVGPVSLPRTSLAEPGSLYMDYVPWVVPRAARSAMKRGLAGSSSADTLALKRLHSLGIQITGSMLLGELIIDFILLLFRCSLFS